MGVGSIKFEVPNGRSINFLTAKNVLYIPGMTDNLISVSKLTKNRLRVLFKDDIYRVYSKGEPVFRAQADSGIYQMIVNIIIPMAEHASPSKDDSDGLHHRRMEQGNAVKCRSCI